jgi:threonine synthase
VTAVSESIAREAAFKTVCTGCHRHLGDGFVAFCPGCGSMSDVEYDLAAVRLRDSPNPYHRYIDLLPVSDVGLLPERATFTPTVHSRSLAARLGMTSLFLKDETRLPTGTTKDRMAAIALPYLHEHGVRGFATSSTGNSSSAYARAIAKIPELTMLVFTASQFRDRLWLPASEQLVDVVLRGATFVEAFDEAGRFATRHGLVAERGFFNPGRREGLKLAWLEAEQQVGRPIDWYVQAVSSAMGVYGVYKGASQLVRAGLSERVPHLLCVQQQTCAPMVSAWRAGSGHIRSEDIVRRPSGIATAILRGDPTRAYPHVRRIVRESGGTFASVTEREIRDAHRLAIDLEGIEVCFAAAAALAGLIQARQLDVVKANETVLVNLTGGVRTGTPPGPDTVWVDRDGDGWDTRGLTAWLGASPIRRGGGGED